MRAPDRFDLTGRTAVVTAGTGGFGGACARALGLAGARITLVSGDREEGEHLVAKLHADDVDADLLCTVLTDPTRVDEAVATILRRRGRVDVLVNAVEESHPSPAVDLAFEDWRRVLGLSLDTVWLWTQALGRVFVGQGSGAVVTVGSTAGTIAGRPHWDPAFAAAKAGVHHLTRALAAEWAPHGVRVNAVAPGHVATDGALTEDPRRRRHVLEDTPMERIGRVDEITPAVVFLASDASSFTTGTVLVADGGYSTC